MLLTVEELVEAPQGLGRPLDDVLDREVETALFEDEFGGGVEEPLDTFLRPDSGTVK